MLLLMVLTMPATAQSPASPPADSVGSEPAVVQRVGRVSVVGNVAVDSSRILRSFEVYSGQRFSEDAIRRGFRKLFALGLFADLQIDRVPRGDEVDLVLRVKERPRIGAIRFEGNKKRESEELEKKIQLRVGEVYSPVVVQVQVDSLLKYYREEGYAQAAITGRADTVAMHGDVAVVFDVKEGERVKIEAIELVGADHLPEGKLRKNMKSKPRGLLGGGDVAEENFAEDRDKLERYYRSNGYRDVRIVGHELVPGKSPKSLILRVTIDEGPLYRFGRVAWSGNKVVDTRQLERAAIFPMGSVYDASRIEKAQGDAYASYAEQGYLYVGIEPRETVHGDSLVDVTFAVQEGRPSNVRYVVISGNKGTREHVIRRESSIREGDIFRRSALVRTQGDIFRLGLFEDVGIDFTPADSTDVDIQLKVKEKQVGTASAGAGYTAESGVTGFVELGHNNVLGNAQALQLHLERGGRRSDYSVSFTEPWFRGTPTLLGISAFNSSRDRDVYTEKRVGGSVRVGRPLPWPDYSRGSVAYRIENVTISQLGAILTPADSIALRGLVLGVPTLTSSLELAFVRNTANNPFYPTKGTRLTIGNELAGGPIGGAVDFDKFRVDARVYLPGALPFMTTMIRGRIGVLSPLLNNVAVPEYERFRLGGGTTVDPLRGYDDYQVVPSKFISSVPIAYRPDTTYVPDGGGGTDTTVTNVAVAFQKVRYPGGRFMLAYTVEQQFPIVAPLRGVFFFDAGNTWDLGRDVHPFDILMGAGAGLRMEIPLLGNIGFDYGYGFDRDDGARWVGHLLIGNVNF